jgi:uncharacterized protein involved in cysteine biosynthesis
MSVFGGLLWLLRHPRTWWLAAVPVAVLVLLGTIAAYLAFVVLRPELAAALPRTESWYWSLAVSVAATAGAVLAAVLGLLLAYALTPPLSAPALEGLVERVEAEVQAPPRRSVGWLAQTWCGLRASLTALMVTGPLLVVASLVELLVPFAVVVTLPIQLFSAALFSAFSMLDYPLTLRGVRIRKRFAFMASAAGPVLGFGAACVVLFAIPCGAIVLLPVGVVAGTRLLWSVLTARPEARPLLEV